MLGDISLKKLFILFRQVEGKGNGIKTVISNMVEVSKCLGRPPTCKYPSNYIGKALMGSVWVEYSGVGVFFIEVLEDWGFYSFEF